MQIIVTLQRKALAQRGCTTESKGGPGMANVNGNFSFSVVDQVGVRGAITLPVRFADTVTLAQLQTAWGAQKTLLQAILGGSITKGGISFGEAVATPPAAVSGSRFEETGVFGFAVTGSANKQGLALGAFLNSKAPLDKIDLADTDVLAWTTAISGAITGGGVYATPDGVALGALVSAFFSTRKKRRQEYSHTIEQA